MLFLKCLVLSRLNCVKKWLVGFELLLEELQYFIRLQLSHQNLYFFAESLDVLLRLLKIEDAHHLPPVLLHEICPLLLFVVEIFNVFEVVFIGVDVLKFCHFVAELLLILP